MPKLRKRWPHCKEIFLPDNAERLGLYGTSFGCANATYTAGIDERMKCIVGVVGPGDCERQFRLGPNFDRFAAQPRQDISPWT